MKYRDAFGRLEYRLDEFFVPYNKSGKFEILRKHPWYVTGAVIWDDYTCWEKVPKFDSFIQAVKYLKDNIDCLA